MSHYDYGFRIYNPSIARFLSVDPLTKSYPMLTPYQFASNTPIGAIDLDGLESKEVVTKEANAPHIPALLPAAEQQIKRTALQRAAEGVGNALKPVAAVPVMVIGFVLMPTTLDAPGSSFPSPSLPPVSLKPRFENPYEDNPNPIEIPESPPIDNTQVNNTPLPLRLDSPDNLPNDNDDDNSRILYRFDIRPPAVIAAAGGFESRGDNLDLELHAYGITVADGTSAYVSTSKFESSALRHAKGRPGFIYEIRDPGHGRDVNLELGSESPHPHEHEVAFPYIVPLSNVNIHNPKPVN